MHTTIRFLLRGILLIFPEEFGNARIDMKAAQTTHAVGARVNAELRIFRTGMAGLRQLEREAAKAMLESPAAAELIVAMLQERMETLRVSIHDAAAQRKAA